MPAERRVPARIRRRRVAALAILVALLIAGWLLACGVPGTLVGKADPHGASVSELTVGSKAVGKRLPVKVVVPAGKAHGRRPLLIFLHGRTGNESSELTDPMFAALAKLGERAPVIAFPYGGDHSYWHDRSDGAWGRYLFDEVIPQVGTHFKTDPGRVAIGGISMGGFGALDLARLHPGFFCAAGGHSPAIWANGGETAPGAFDNADDFARHDLVGTARTHPSELTRQPLWLDAGTADPFQPGDAVLIAALRTAHAPLTAHTTWPGGHNGDYWGRHWTDYLTFYANALQHCHK